MLLVDSTYIHIGGAKIVLDYLVEELEKTDINVFYLFDARVEKKPFKIKSTNKFLYIDGVLRKRVLFYKKNNDSFNNVIVVGNIPPPVKLNCNVITYFHNPMYLAVPQDFSFVQRFLYLLKVMLINKWKKNTDVWFVQSTIIREMFTEKFGETRKIEILPFFKPLRMNHKKLEKKKQTYFFPSTGQENKNHKRLIEAFCNFYDKYMIGELILTVPEQYEASFAIITKAINSGYPVVNLGYVDRNSLIEYYEKSEYLMFPSLSESLGLGIIEGIEFECKVIGADLPYTYAVCEPSLVFNPLDSASIEKAFIQSISCQKISVAKIHNEINRLINLLS